MSCVHGLPKPRRTSGLNRLNRDLLARVEKSGEAFFSNAVIDGKFVLRACIVNFNTTDEDIDALPELIARHAALAVNEG